jgi:hypothetical protein
MSHQPCRAPGLAGTRSPLPLLDLAAVFFDKQRPPVERLKKKWDERLKKQWDPQSRAK